MKLIVTYDLHLRLLFYASHCSLVTGSVVAAQMAYNKAVSFRMGKISPLEVGMGDLSSPKVHGKSAVHVMLSVNGSCVNCVPEIGLYVPNLSNNLHTLCVID